MVKAAALWIRGGELLQLLRILAAVYDLQTWGLDFMVKVRRGYRGTKLAEPSICVRICSLTLAMCHGRTPFRQPVCRKTTSSILI